MKYVCSVCGYEYDPDLLPEDLPCPVGGVSKDQSEHA